MADSPLDIAKMAVAGLNSDQGSSDTGDRTVEQVPGSTNYLKSILDRRRGTAEVPSREEDPAAKFAAEVTKVRQEFDTKLEKIEAERQAQAGLAEKQLKALETLANRPVQTQIVQPQPQPEPLPTYTHEDEQLVAALNTLEKRFDMKNERIVQALVGQQQQQSAAMAQREFSVALRRMKTAYPDWNNYFNDEQVRADASKILSNPAYANANIDWDNELTLAYRAKASADWVSELEELRKFKAEHEKKGTQNQGRQKADLHLVPTMGSRGGDAPQQGLIADTILADARRAGKRTLSPKEFGKEWSRRRKVG